MVKLIIDTDPGIDDAMAIFYAAAAPDIDLLGLTTIFGNVTTATATRNALRLLEAADLDVPVAAGATTPLVLPPFKPSAYVHGDEGFGDIPAAEPKGKPLQEDAADFLCRMAREHKGELVVCPIGPLTNIALAMQRDAEFIANVKAIVVMGGSLEEGGNITPHAEANIYHDPHAADVVCQGGSKVVFVGLDVTHRILCRPEDFEAIAAKSPELGGMLQEMSHFYIKFYREVAGLNGCSLHDPAAVIACTNPDLFGMRDVALEVSCEGETSGATVAAPDSTRDPVKVCMTVESDAVKALFLKRLALLP
ncbi:MULTISPECIES: nucleoside hydrolase [unclassified Leisingera]|uniref:nucleoside hydrolase n=1 Tax=unclassified Leisingera TaxID=2614906 RepID=UPI0002E8BCD8|nr:MULTISPECIES: nucleoside hydrolase [unclassified Leisingera]KIC24838.1 nucleoside hydrolase [Leisingera sp. ANG-S3]KIC55306.1 nucleoside hydrolase [Leisingera sp. ANG-S]KID09038.1 nucleoside hydrolase [Leisingera sp. ANG1]